MLGDSTGSSGQRRRPSPPSRNHGKQAKTSANSPDCTQPTDDRELTGRLHYVTRHRNRAHTLATWRITTTSSYTAERVAQLLGGQVRDDPANGLVEIVTDGTEIKLLLSKDDAVQMCWSHGTGRCGGPKTMDRTCTCPWDFAAHGPDARLGPARVPRVRVEGQLMRSPGLGTFEFVSGNRRFAEEAARVAVALQQQRGPVRVTLGLTRSAYTLRSGRRILDTRPSLTTARARSRNTARAVRRGGSTNRSA